MSERTSFDGSLLGTLCAGGLTLLAGTGLPILLLPESNLAPIMGLFCAPPAGLLGAVLGSFIERKKLALLPAFLLGAVTGVLLPLILVVRSGSQSPEQIGPVLFMLAIPALIFGATGALVQGVCGRAEE